MASLCFSVRSSSSCAVKKIHRIKCFRNNDQTRRLFSVTCGAMTSLLGRTRRGRHALPCFFLLFPLGDRQASSVVTRNYLLTGEAAGKNKPLADGGGAPLNEARHACGKMSRRHERGKEMARGGRRRKNAAHETSSTRKKPFFPSRNRAESTQGDAEPARFLPPTRRRSRPARRRPAWAAPAPWPAGQSPPAACR